VPAVINRTTIISWLMLDELEKAYY